MSDSLDCVELVELVTAYLDGALDPTSEARVRRHLRECPGCAAYLAQVRQAAEGLQTAAERRLLGRQALPPEVREALGAAWREARGSAAGS